MARDRRRVKTEYLFNFKKMYDQKIAFMSGFSRPCYPLKLPKNRIGNSVPPTGGASAAGPASYEVDECTNLKHELDGKKFSNKGYTMRTGSRLHKHGKACVPAPNTYQGGVTDPTVSRPATVPFHSVNERFPQDTGFSVPGPGSYDHDIPQNRQVAWPQSFGRSPVMLPPLSRQSTIPISTRRLNNAPQTRKYINRLAYLKMYWD